MRVARLEPLAFRNLADRTVEFGPGLTVLHGPNGAGKTNLLEAMFFALTGRSCRTRREREAIRFGEELARVEARLEPDVGPRAEIAEPMTMLASVSSGQARRRLVDGSPARPEDDRRRPALSVFMPDRLALVKGPPSPRRAHLDRLSAAMRPARGDLRRGYSQALAQRNNLLARIKRGGDPSTLSAWDRELAERAAPLVESRSEAAHELAGPFANAASELGLAGGATLAYRPRTGELDVEGIVAELEERRDGDVARGFTGYGPHRDEVELSFGGRSLRRYGSQGQQRLGLLALLFAEREALRQARRQLPLMLLDDVMSELDPERRERLAALLGEEGQALITATESDHVPSLDYTEIAISAGNATDSGGIA